MAEAYGNSISAASVTGYSGSYYRSYISATIKSETATQITYTLRNNVQFVQYTGGWGSTTTLAGQTVASDANIYNSSGNGWAQAGTTSKDITIDKTNFVQTKSYSSTANIQYLGTSTATVTLTIQPISEFTVSANAETGGTALVDGEASVTVESGTQVSYAATPSNHYNFVGWYENDTLVSSNNPYVLTVTRDITLTAKFEGESVLVSTSVGSYISSVNGAGTYEYGTQCTLQATLIVDTVQYRYAFDGWYLNNTKVSSNLSYTFTVTNGGTYEARGTRTLKTYQVLVYKGSNISTVSGAGTYIYGSSVTIQATLPADTNYDKYTFDGWYNENDRLISTDLVYTFTLQGAVTLTAKATRSERLFNVYARSAGNGSAYVDGNVTVAVSYGDEVTFTASANTGYNFNRWSDGNTQAERVVTIHEDLTLIAYFTSLGPRTRVKSNGTWNTTSTYTKLNNLQKKVIKAFAKVNGIWKQVQ